MTESNTKPKVPALNLLSKGLLTPSASQTTQLSTAQTAAASQQESEETKTQAHSFYTSRVATDEYKIKGMQDGVTEKAKTKEQLIEADNEGHKKRKRKHKKRNGKKADASVAKDA